MKNVVLQPQSRAIAIINSHHDINHFKASGWHFECRHIVVVFFLLFVLQLEISLYEMQSGVLIHQCYQAWLARYIQTVRRNAKLPSSSSKWPNHLIKYQNYTDQKLSTKVQDVLYRKASHIITQISPLKCSKWSRQRVN